MWISFLDQTGAESSISFLDWIVCVDSEGLMVRVIHLWWWWWWWWSRCHPLSFLLQDGIFPTGILGCMLDLLCYCICAFRICVFLFCFVCNFSPFNWSFLSVSHLEVQFFLCCSFWYFCVAILDAWFCDHECCSIKANPYHTAGYDQCSTCQEIKRVYIVFLLLRYT